MFRLMAATLAACLVLFPQEPESTEQPLSTTQQQTVTVSFYSGKYNGRRTTSGQRFSNKKLTAAHLTLPLGSHLRLTNPTNQKTVEVVVNDRGPHVSGRDLSITRRAARELGILRAGVGQLQMEVLP